MDEDKIYMIEWISLIEQRSRKTLETLSYEEIERQYKFALLKQEDKLNKK